MTRRLLNLMTVVSLVLCTAACVLWVRSYWRTDSAARFPGAGHLVGAWSDRGKVVVWAQPWRGATPHWELDSMPRVPWGQLVTHTPPRSFLGFAAARNPPPDAYRYVVVPTWSVALLAAVLPAIWLRARLSRGARARRGRCLACGYDLRATPGRCPECGTATTRGGSGAR